MFCHFSLPLFWSTAHWWCQSSNYYLYTNWTGILWVREGSGQISLKHKMFARGLPSYCFGLPPVFLADWQCVFNILATNIFACKSCSWKFRKYTYRTGWSCVISREHLKIIQMPPHCAHIRFLSLQTFSKCWWVSLSVRFSVWRHSVTHLCFICIGISVGRLSLYYCIIDIHLWCSVPTSENKRDYFGGSCCKRI